VGLTLAWYLHEGYVYEQEMAFSLTAMLANDACSTMRLRASCLAIKGANMKPLHPLPLFFFRPFLPRRRGRRLPSLSFSAR
jgi:hypothetical protein